MTAPRTASLAALLLGLALPLAGCPGSRPAAQPKASGGTAAPARRQGPPPDGAALFKNTCSACHGPEGRGLPNLGKDLASSAFIHGQTDDQMVEFLKRGRGTDDPLNTTKVAMPPKGGNPALKDEDLRAIVAHLRDLQKQVQPQQP
jgi:disulfide bond formation protein DsbB